MTHEFDEDYSMRLLNTTRIDWTFMPSLITVSPDVLQAFRDIVQFDNAEWALVDNLVAAREGLRWISCPGQPRLILPPVQLRLPLED